MITAIVEAILIWFVHHAIKAYDHKQLKLIVVSILAAYIIGIIIITIGIRGIDSEARINMIPFHTIYILIRQLVQSVTKWGIKNIPHELTFMIKGMTNLFGNILLLLPLGCLIPFFWIKMNKWWKAVTLGIVVSLLIEIIQLLTHRGYFDVDDVILNSLGCLIGWQCHIQWLQEKT